MAATSQITVNAAGFTAITTQSFCKNVRIMENPGVTNWPTTDYLIAKPTAGTTPVRIPAGQSYTFNSPASFFTINQIAGYVKAVTGSTTFDQDEDQP